MLNYLTRWREEIGTDMFNKSARTNKQTCILRQEQPFRTKIKYIILNKQKKIIFSKVRLRRIEEKKKILVMETMK